VFTSLTVLGDTSLEFTDTSSNDNWNVLAKMIYFKGLTDSAVSLGSASNHVLDKIAMSRCVNDGDVVFGSFKLPKSDIDGDTTLTFGL